MPCGKEDPGRNEGARAHGDALPFELSGRGHGHECSYVAWVRTPVRLAVYNGLCHAAGQQDG